MDLAITDFQDRAMVVGTTVRMWWDDKFPFPPQEGDGQFGTVLDLGEWEGDNDDEGRPIGIAPSVTVLWENGTTAAFKTTEWEWDGGYYWREPVSGKVEELDVVEGPTRPVVWRDSKGRLLAFFYAGSIYDGEEINVHRQKFEVVELNPYEPSNYCFAPTFLVTDPDGREVCIDAGDLDTYWGIKDPDPEWTDESERVA